MTKLKILSRKVRHSLHNHLNSKLVIESILENCFEVSMSPKTNVLNIWKEQCLDFCKVLRYKIETVFSKSGAEEQFKFKVGHKRHFWKWLWGYLELENECSGRLTRAFFTFLANFWVTKCKLFSRKGRRSFRERLNSKLVIGKISEKGFEPLKMRLFNFLQIFE